MFGAAWSAPERPAQDISGKPSFLFRKLFTQTLGGIGLRRPRHVLHIRQETKVVHSQPSALGHLVRLRSPGSVLGDTLRHHATPNYGVNSCPGDRASFPGQSSFERHWRAQGRAKPSRQSSIPRPYE